MACMFVQGLPGLMKRPLQSSFWVDDISLEEMLARARAFMKDEVAVDKPVVAAVQPAWIAQPSPGIEPTCYMLQWSHSLHKGQFIERV